MKKEVVHIDLFSGGNIFFEAMKAAGIVVTHHYYSEVDVHAIATTRYHYHEQKTPSTYIGSVEHLCGRSIREQHPHAFIITTFGFPCQDISIAGAGAGIQHPDRMPVDLAKSLSYGQYKKLRHQLAGDMGKQADTTRSGLLFEAARICSESQTDCFVAENVKNLFSVNAGADILETTRLLSLFRMGLPQYHTEMQLVNTLWFLPQNRERVFFVGYARERSFRKVLPIRKGDAVFDKEGANKGRKGTEIWSENSYSSTIDASMGSIRDAGETLIKVGNISDSGHSQKGQIFSDKGVSPSLAAGTHGYVNGFVAVHPIATVDLPNKKQNGKRIKEPNAPMFTLESNFRHGVAVKVGTLRTHKEDAGFREIKEGHCPSIPSRSREDGSGMPIIMASRGRKNEEGKWMQKLEASENANSITSVQKDNLLAINSAVNQGYEIAEAGDCIDIENPKSTTRKGRVGKGKASNLTTYPHKCFFDGMTIRRLTEIECERLQGWEDNWTQYGIYPPKKRVQQLNNLVKLGWIKANSKSYWEVFIRLVETSTEPPKEISGTQRYKIIGNGISTPPTQSIFSNIKTQLL